MFPVVVKCLLPCIEAVDGKIYIIYTWSQDIYAKVKPIATSFYLLRCWWTNLVNSGSYRWISVHSELRQNSMAVDAAGVFMYAISKFGVILNNPDLIVDNHF